MRKEPRRYLKVRMSWMGCKLRGWPVEEVALKEIGMVEVPEGVTTGGGVVTAALPAPQPALAKAMQKVAARRTPQKATRILRVARGSARRFLAENASKEQYS